MRCLGVVALVFAVAFLSTAAVFFTYLHFKLDSVVEYDAYLTVGNHTGINVDTDAVYFGTVKPGAQITRVLQVKNGNRPTKVEVVATGSLAPWLTIPESKFALQNEGIKEVKVMLSVPKMANANEYSGKIFVISKRV